MKKITIIGAGVSGTLLAIKLIRQHKGEGELTINIVEREYDKFNKGVAYSTTEMSHVLNVRASAMSIYKCNPGHFEQWLIKKNYGYKGPDFVPRMIFAEYVKSEFDKAVSGKSSKIYINMIIDEAIDIQRRDETPVIKFKSGRFLYTDIVVFALGHISVSEIDTLKYSNIYKYFRTPWDNTIYDKIDQTDDVLLIGSGLTTDDVILSLHSRKHDGKIYSLSRSGMQPLPHETFDAYPGFNDELKDLDINGIFKVVRKHLQLAKNPRAVIDSLRPFTQTIWQSLSATDKSRFLRHLNKYWNVIRHRMPEKNYNLIKELQKSQLDFITGNIVSIEDGRRIKVTYFNKTTRVNDEIYVDAIINCIGPESNYKRLNMPLIQNLFERGTIKQNETGISIKTDGWHIVDVDNKPNQQLLAIGPLLKGELFESTAVPELKIQSSQMAEYILNIL
jgi:uncharacterized NAD(P)/FAD-binding protein YdhS